jgi:hypothetical protein
MKKFVFTIVGFGIAVLIMLNLFKATLPFYWANEEFCDKMELFNADDSGFDLIYIGPSAVKREFIPSVFESSLDTLEIRAFNFGTAGVYYAEENYLVRNAMTNEAFIDVEYVLAFGQEPKKIMDDHFHKLRIKYALDWHSYISCLRYFYEKQDMQQVYRYTIMFIENQLCIGEIFEMVEWHFTEFGVPEELHELAGYVPYEWSVSNSIKSSNQHDKFLNEHEEDKFIPGFRKKPSTKNGIRKASNSEFVLIKDLYLLNEIARISEKTFIPVYEPNMNDFIGLDSLQVIYFGDGKNYPEYFAIENRWDFKHLNEKGAIFHSELLAKLFENEISGVTGQDNDEKIKGGNKKNDKAKSKKKKGEKKIKGGKKKKRGVKKDKRNDRGKKTDTSKKSKKNSKKKSKKRKASIN